MVELGNTKLIFFSIIGITKKGTLKKHNRHKCTFDKKNGLSLLFTCLTWQVSSAGDVLRSCVENTFPPQNCYLHQVGVIQVDCGWLART